MIEPQIILGSTGGFRLPSVVIIDNTKVPESAEVTRKMKISRTAVMLSSCPPGK